MADGNSNHDRRRAVDLVSANRGGRISRSRAPARAQRPTWRDGHKALSVELAGQRRQSSAGRWLRESECTAAPGTGIDNSTARFGRLSAADQSQVRASLNSDITARSSAPILKQDNLK